MVPLGRAVGGYSDGEGGATERREEVGDVEDEVLLDESVGKGYSNGVLLVAKGVPTIWELGE